MDPNVCTDGCDHHRSVAISASFCPQPRRCGNLGKGMLAVDHGSIGDPLSAHAIRLSNGALDLVTIRHPVGDRSAIQGVLVLEGLPYHGLVRNHADLEFPIAIQHQHAHRRGIHRRHRDAALESHESANLDFVVDRRNLQALLAILRLFGNTSWYALLNGRELSQFEMPLLMLGVVVSLAIWDISWSRLDRLQRELWTLALRILFVILLVVNGYMSLILLHLLH